ncbi:MAG: cytochrome c3 family protein [Nitrospirota bacterium]
MKIKILIIGLSLCFLSPISAHPAQKHECSFCHLPAAEGKGMQLKEPVNDLCLKCHPTRKCVNESEHEVDIVPSMTVEGLPLSSDGKMTCITCHNPHKWSSLNLLRMEPTLLCLKCHPEY